MPRPGTDIRIVDDAPRGGAILDTGQAFFVGVAGRGSSTKAEKVQSTAEYATKFGERADGSLLYDAVSAFFAEGGSTLYVSRAVGSGATEASGTLGTDLNAKAVSPGTWGNNLDLTVEDDGYGGKVVSVALDDEEVERSPSVATATEAAAWSNGSGYVRLTKGTGDTLPATGTTAALTGGVNGGAPGATELEDALARFEYGLGPGQVAAPGYTTTAVHEAVLAHCEAMRRCALIDLPDSASVAALTTAVQALRGVPGVRNSLPLAPWINYPAEASGAVITVPYSGVQAGLIARADAQSGNPNQPAAGASGIHRLSLGLSQEFTDADRQHLNEQGVALAKVKYGAVRTYGYRTGAGPADTNWLWFGNSRVVMAIAHEADAVAENYVLKQIDGRRQLFAALEADLRGVLLDHYTQGALFGESPEEAFSVNTGPTVNTIDTIKRGEVHAVIRVKCSPAGEWVQIDIVKVPVEAPLAA